MYSLSRNLEFLEKAFSTMGSYGQMFVNIVSDERALAKENLKAIQN